MSMHWAWDKRTLGVPMIECRAFMKLERGFLIMVSNLEFFDSSAILLISSNKKPIILSILPDSRRQISLIFLLYLFLRKASRPVGVNMQSLFTLYFPTKNFTDFSPSSNTLTFFEWVHTLFLDLFCALTFLWFCSLIVVSVDPLNIWCIKASVLNSRSAL